LPLLLLAVLLPLLRRRLRTEAALCLRCPMLLPAAVVRKVQKVDCHLHQACMQLL
jgi:hypothetical protein